MSGKRMIGVLLMAHGSPDNLDDMDAYLQHVRGGRATPQVLVDDIRGRYQLIGGRSPLLDLTVSTVSWRSVWRPNTRNSAWGRIGAPWKWRRLS